MVKFSGYWPVDSNPKKSAKQGHLKHLKEKEVDLLFCDKEYFIGCKQVKIQPPAELLIKKFDNPAFLKFGKKIDTEVFRKLVVIWTSKILLFKRVAEIYPDENEFVWVDCVTWPNFDLIINADSLSGCVINKYCGENTNKMYKRPYNDPDFKSLDTYLLASVIKMHRKSIDAFERMYVDYLQVVDKQYKFYDEEIVLSAMYKDHPEMFKVIN